MELVNLDDLEVAAREKLPTMIFDYYKSGACDEITLRENHTAYDRIKLRYRVLVDVSSRNLSTTVLGHQVSMPILIAPTAFQKMSHPDGELATARAAGKAGTIMILSTLSTSSIEEVMAVAGGAVWYQLYVFRDREVTKNLVKRAEDAGCSALVLTVDLPLTGRRERDIRNRFELPPGLCAKNLMPVGLEQFPEHLQDSGLAAYTKAQFDPSLTWKDVEWLRSITRLPLLLKGIVRGDDAARAVECGVSGIVVSNHGGRQLDTAPATIEVLPEIVAAVDKRLEILIDGGISRGTDIVKAIALGAKAVLIGRPVLWGLAANGEDGVSEVLEHLRTDFDLSMALCGCPSIADIAPDLILQ